MIEIKSRTSHLIVVLTAAVARRRGAARVGRVEVSVLRNWPLRTSVLVRSNYLPFGFLVVYVLLAPSAILAVGNCFKAGLVSLNLTSFFFLFSILALFTFVKLGFFGKDVVRFLVCRGPGVRIISVT